MRMKRLKSKLLSLVSSWNHARIRRPVKLVEENILRLSHHNEHLSHSCLPNYLFCREKGRVVGGTKGNFILEYVSGAPNKERIIDRVPNVFDYDELTKYGFSVS
jgi:hypothetical protein